MATVQDIRLTSVAYLALSRRDAQTETIVLQPLSSSHLLLHDVQRTRRAFIPQHAASIRPRDGEGNRGRIVVRERCASRW